jgi:hypothetical protein
MRDLTLFWLGVVPLGVSGVVTVGLLAWSARTRRMALAPREGGT